MTIGNMCARKKRRLPSEKKKQKKTSEDSQIYRNRIEDVRRKRQPCSWEKLALKISLKHVRWYCIQFQLQHFIPPTGAVQTVLLSSWSRSSTFHHGAKDKDQIWRLIFIQWSEHVWHVFNTFLNGLLTKLEDPQHQQHHWHAYTSSTKTWASALSNKSSKCQCSQAPKRLFGGFSQSNHPKQKQTGDAECLCNSDSNDASLVSASITLTSESCRARYLFVNLLFLSPTKNI